MVSILCKQQKHELPSGLYFRGLSDSVGIHKKAHHLFYAKGGGLFSGAGKA